MNLHSKHLKTLQTLFSKHPAITQALLFGSRALGTHKESSDIDIALKGDITPTLLAHLKEALEDSTLPYFCDILDYERAPQELKEHIDTHVLTLYKREEEWQEVRLGDMVEINKNNLGKNFEYENILYLDTGSITRNQISSLQTLHISNAPSRAKRLLGKRNIVYSMVRPIQRHFGFIENPPKNLVVSTGFVVIEEKENSLIDLKYLYYFLTLDEKVEFFESIAEGSTSTYPSLKPSDLAELTIPLPPLERQKEIAEILSSFDDKIDFLHRQNRTLESLTTMLYKVLTKDKENSSLLSDIVQIQGGYAFKSKDFLKYGTNRVIKIKNISNSVVDIVNTDFITNSIADTINKKFQILSGDILIAMTGAEVGKVGITPKNSKNLFLNQRVGVVREKIDNAKYLAYLHLKSSFGFEYIVNTASGSAQANISTSQIEQCPFPFFSQEEIEAFSEKVAPFFKKNIENLEKIQNLIKIRESVLLFLLDKDSF